MMLLEVTLLLQLIWSCWHQLHRRVEPQLPIRAPAWLTRHGQASKHIKKTLSSLERPSSPLPSKLVHLQSSCLPLEIHIVPPCQDSVLPCLDTCKLHLSSQTIAIFHFINICNIS